MTKKLLVLCLLISPAFAGEEEDKTQPTKDERIQLLIKQRDFLLAIQQTRSAQDRQAQAGQELDEEANKTGSKYKCEKWNPDFTCEVTKDKPKEDKK